MLDLRITHSVVEGGTVDPTAAIDGAAWDAEHIVTGAENVDNTSDIDKPVSTAQATAIAASTASVTKSSIGLGNVNNTSDASKPVSTATQTALNLKANITSVREILTANRTYFVRADGSNSNNGLANTSGGAFLTLQYAWDYICDKIDAAGFTIIIQLANGTYTGGLATNKAVLGGSWNTIKILGSATPSNVVISTTGADCIGIGTLLSANSHFTIGGVKFTTTTSGHAINVSGGSAAVVFGTPGFPVEFGACAGSHYVGNHACSLFAGAVYIVSGGAGGFHGSALSGALVAIHGTGATFVGAANSLNFGSGTFWDCESNAQLFMGSMVNTNIAAVDSTVFAGLVSSGGKAINYPGTSTLPGNGVFAQPGGGRYLATGTEATPLGDGGTGANLAGGGPGYVHQPALGAALQVSSWPLPTSLGGASNTAWPAFTPALSFTGGTTVASANLGSNCTLEGKKLFYHLCVQITAATPPTGITWTLPLSLTAANYQMTMGANTSSFNIVMGQFSPGSASVSLIGLGAAVAVTAANQFIILNGMIEVA